MLIRFQFASTALTVRLNDVPAVSALGVPVNPVVVPGAAVSPGTKTCNWLNVPGLTVKIKLPLVSFFHLFWSAELKLNFTLPLTASLGVSVTVQLEALLVPT